MGKLVLFSLVLVFALAAIADAAVIYNSIDTPLPGSYPSLGYEATSTSELGDHIIFASGNREISKVAVVLTDWACENDYTYDSATGIYTPFRTAGQACTTTPGSGFNHPITLRIYSVDKSGLTPKAGSLLYEKTQIFNIKYRPSYDATNCYTGSGKAGYPFSPADDQYKMGTWYDPISNKCVYGYNNIIEFDLSSDNFVAPDEIIYSISYNTADYGETPIHSPGPFNSLNYGLSTAALIGTDVEPDTVFMDSTWGGAYCDNGAAGTGTFRRDAGCWPAYVPTSKFTTKEVLGGNGVGGSVDIELETEDFKPLIWMCGNRLVYDDNTEPGRTTEGGAIMTERLHNYAFEGEQIAWNVLVFDKNGIEKIKDVFVSVGPVQGNGQFIEANCQLTSVLAKGVQIPAACNAWLDEEQLSVVEYANTMGLYTCTLTVESPKSMHGQFWVTGNVVDLDNQTANFAENEFWFFNPTIALTFSGTPIKFGTVRPGTQAYSNTITVGNGAELGSGVMLDMFVSGKDFTDPTHSGAKCPSTNQLSLKNFAYYAVNGAYSTVGLGDAEGYRPIGYGETFNSPSPFYGRTEVIPTIAGATAYSPGNLLSPGSEMSVTFRLSLPEPCNGDFTEGQIYFWGEAI